MKKKQEMLNAIMTRKQQKVLKRALFEDWKLMINYGAVRSGKTIIDNYIFLYELRRTAKLAKQENFETPLFILAGVSSKTIWNNVLNPLMNDFGFQIKFDKFGNFNLFGVTVVQAYTGSIGGLGGIRGMTSWGAYINEASLANEEVFNEIRDRCSKGDKRIICDTNPDIPTHWLKKNYIDNPKNSESIISEHFIIDDNTFLDDDYIQNKKKTTPTGMFYDRSILGLWVAGEGAVYRDFDERTMLKDQLNLPPDVNYYCGVDWGYEHKGSIVVMADDQSGHTYLVEEITHQYKEIDYWVDTAKHIQSKYGSRIPFHADSARAEYVARFVRENINCYNANKSVLSGIEEVAKLIKTGHFFVSREGTKGMKFLDEIYEYIWDEKTGLPVKQNDDVMDALRYAIYSQHHKTAHAHAASFHF